MYLPLKITAKIALTLVSPSSFRGYTQVAQLSDGFLYATDGYTAVRIPVEGEHINALLPISVLKLIASSKGDVSVSAGEGAISVSIANSGNYRFGEPNFTYPKVKDLFNPTFNMDIPKGAGLHSSFLKVAEAVQKNRGEVLTLSGVSAAQMSLWETANGIQIITALTEIKE